MNKCRSVLSIALVAVMALETIAFAGNTPRRRRPPRTNTVRAERVSTQRLQELLGRAISQREFANQESLYLGGGGVRAFAAASSVTLESAPMGGGSEQPREQQESDVFKVGSKDSKLLFLLNDHRGLQVVSFAHGPESPRIMGRVAPTGNRPEDMYFDEAKKRLIVLERQTFDESGNYNYSYDKSRLVIYDVSSPRVPKIAQIIDVAGEITESRLVGSVLYLATRTNPDNNTRRHGQAENKARGFVTSYSVAGDEVKQVQQHELTLPVNRRENMGIIEVKKADGYHYYVSAVLSNSRMPWSWFDRQSYVELIDITDPHGKISPVVVVSAKGRVDKRSWVHIKDDTLIVTSNYDIPGNNPDRSWERTQRVAVETFILPTEQSEVLTQNEAQYRKLHIERGLVGKSGDALEKARLEALEDAQLGIKGRFVRNDDSETITKLMADSTLTLGDDTGLSANIQDVRYLGDNAMIFWVPQNMVDPFDLVNIANVREGLQYLGREHFAGWASKTFPVVHDGHLYVLALGYVVDPVNNEAQRRSLKAMLFEVLPRRGKLKPEIVAEKTLSNRNAWGKIDDQDKFVEVRMTGEGKGTIMFQISMWDQDAKGQLQAISGAKLLSFDLNKAEQDTDNVFTEGGVLAGNSYWLKRVFTNPEIDRINTFTDSELGVFNSASQSMATQSAESVQRAVATLELARNIVGYTTLKTGDRTQGIQIISRGRSWLDYNSDQQATILRVVDGRFADAHAVKHKSEITVPGSYRGHAISADGRSLVIASQIDRSHYNHETSAYVYDKKVYVSKIELDGLNLALRMQLEEQLPVEEQRIDDLDVGIMPMAAASVDGGPEVVNEGNAQPVVATTTDRVRFDSSSLQMGGLVETGTPDTWLLSTAGGMRVVKMGNTYMSSSRVDEAPVVKGTVPANVAPTLVRLGDRLFAHYRVPVTDQSDQEIDEIGMYQYVRHYMLPLNLVKHNEADYSVKLGAPYNIPGDPVSYDANQRVLLTDDSLVHDRHAESDEPYGRTNTIVVPHITMSHLTAVPSSHGQNATLIDTKPKSILDGTQLSSMHQTRVGPVFVKMPANSIVNRWDGRAFYREPVRFGLLTSDLEGIKVQWRIIRGLELKGPANLAQVVVDPTNLDRYYGLVTLGQMAQVITWNTKTLTPEVVPVSVVNERGRAAPQAVTVFRITGGSHFYWNYGSGEDNKMYFDAERRSIVVPTGMGGICQLHLASKTTK